MRETRAGNSIGMMARACGRARPRPLWRCLWLSVLLGAVVFSMPAAAGDRALIDFIGYSRAQRYLAFEEYGTNDGVNAAYSNIYIYDQKKQDFAEGSPFRSEADENLQQPLAEIRAKTREAAKKALADLDIDTPAEIEMLSGDGVIGPS